MITVLTKKKTTKKKKSVARRRKIRDSFLLVHHFEQAHDKSKHIALHRSEIHSV